MFSMTVDYMKYKDVGPFLKILFLKKNTHKAEGSFKVLNMDTICYWAVLKGRDMENIKSKSHPWAQVHKYNEQHT